MPTWSPGDPWPGTAGGASSPHWGPYVRLYVLAALEAGRAFHIGAHANDRLNAGNVLSESGVLVLERDAAGEPVLEPAPAAVPPLPGRLWHDLTCDALEVELAGGASAQAGIFSKADAATLVVQLTDPGGIYDPLNPVPPFAFGSRSRLTPGVPVYAFAEIVDPATAAITRRDLFTGTADSWQEDWTPNPRERTSTLTATDETKRWARYDQPEPAAVGAGETTAQRIARLVTFYGWPGTIDAAASSSITLQATTLDGTGWELVNRVLDNELGFAYFTGSGHLRWTNRGAWSDVTAPVLALGCDPAAYDVLIDASPGSSDTQIRNVIYAQRLGGAVQSAISSSSVGRFGKYEHKNTELELETDGQAGAWANSILLLYAYAQAAIDDVTAVPGILEGPASADLWRVLLGLALVTDIVRIVWAPPDLPTHEIDLLMRAVGFEHRISRTRWEVKLNVIAADPLGIAGTVFTLGPHANDRLDAGNVLALA